MASSPCDEAIFHKDNIRVAHINTIEELSLHSMFFSSMYSIMNDEDGLLVCDHIESSLGYGFSSHESIGLKYYQGKVWNSSEDIPLLHPLLLLMYSYTMTSRIASSSFEDGEVLAITMAHLGLLFHLIGDYYNLLSKLMLQEPYD